jgi:putative peptidoglycan lipid II flippase
LAAYSLGLAGYAAVKVLSPAFYALNDARTPMLISIGSIVVNFVMNSLLVGPFGHVGLAFSTSTVALVNFLLLAVFMRRRLGRLGGRRLATTVLRVAAASCAMAAGAWFASELLSWLPLRGFGLHLLQVIAALALAAVIFYAGCRLLGVEELDDAVNALGGRFMRLVRRR